MTNYGAVFKLHCPRCGNKDFSEEIYDSGKNTYHKCMHCGADVCSDEHTHIGIVIEAPFVTFTPNTYDDIRGIDGVHSYCWKLPEPKTYED